MMQFHVANMTCGGCARGVTKAIHSIDPDARVHTDPPSRRVEVETVATRENVVSALQAAGFPPTDV